MTKEEITKRFCKFELCTHRNGEGTCCLYNQDNCIFHRLEKENAELKEQCDKWFVFETEAGNWGIDKATQYTVDRHNYFYGTKEECQKWGVEHKIKDYTGHKYCYDRLDNQFTKAKELLGRLVTVCKIVPLRTNYDVVKQAEQFLKEIEK